MKCAVKILIVAFLFTVALSSDCAAKIISDSSGRYSFETSDAWKFINAGTSSTDNIELLSIRLDKDTGILFNQLKTNVNYKNISEMSAEDKNKLKDALVQYNLEEFSEYSFTVDKAEVLEDGIFLGFSSNQNGERYALGELYFIKDYRMYFLFITGTSQTIVESVNTAFTLKIDGVKFTDWLKN